MAAAVLWLPGAVGGFGFNGCAGKKTCGECVSDMQCTCGALFFKICVDKMGSFESMIVPVLGWSA